MALLVGELYALLLLEKKLFMRGLKEAEAAAKATSLSMAQKFTRAGKMIAIGLGAAVIGLAAVGGAALSAAVDFEKGMANIQTLMGTGSAVDARIKELGNSVKDMAKVTGKSLGDLQAGLYDIIGTFTDTADSAKWLEVAAKTGAAGLSTTKEAILLLGAVTKAYGDTSIEAARKAADLAFETANLGVTTIPQMAAAMGKMLPIAAALKVSQEELFGAMATLTGATGDTAEVTTQLRSVMTAFLKPNTMMTKAIRESGFASGMAMVQQLGLAGAMKLIGGTSIVADKGIAKVFGRVESLTAVLALNGEMADTWAWKTDAMTNAAGRLDRAFEIQQRTAAAMADRVGAAIEVMAVNVGNKLLPAWKDFLSWVEDNMPAIEKAVLGAVDAIAAGLSVAASVVGFFVDKFQTAWSILGDLEMQGPVIAAAVLMISAAFVAWGISAAGAAVAVVAATWPILAIIAVIAIAVKVLVEVFDHFGISVSDIFAWLGKTAKDFAQAFLSVIGSIANVISMLPGTTGEAFGRFRDQLDQMHRDVGQWGADTAAAVKTAGSTIANGIYYPVKDVAAKAGDYYDMAGSTVGDRLIGGVIGSIQSGTTLTEEQMMALGLSADQALALGIEQGESLIDEAVESLVVRFGTSMDGVKFAAEEAGGALMTEMAKGIADARQEPVTAFDTLKEMLKNAMSPAKERMRLLGQLMSKELAKGMRSKDPAVRAQAEGTKKLIIERLQQLIDEGKPLGKKGMDAITKGMKSKDKDIRRAAQHAKNVLIDGVRPVVAASGRIGTQAGNALATKFKAIVGRITVNFKMPHMSISGGGFGANAYASGAWRIPRDELAFIHQGEMVVPAAAANRIRQAAAQPSYDAIEAGGGRQSQSPREVHNHLTVTGLVKARNPFEIVKQQQRLADFGVMKWPQSQEVVG